MKIISKKQQAKSKNYWQKMKNFVEQISIILTYAAFTLSGFDNQERNLMFVKTAFQVLILKFLACSMKQAFYLLHKQNIAQA